MACGEGSEPRPASTKESVAIVVRNSKGEFLAVKRADDDDSLPCVWGLPAASLRGAETAEQAVIRIGRQKLGIDLEISDLVGEDSEDRGQHCLHLAEYAVHVIRGEPSVPQPDQSVSQYTALQYTLDPGLLSEAARRGSLCCRIFLRSQGAGFTRQSG